MRTGKNLGRCPDGNEIVKIMLKCKPRQDVLYNVGAAAIEPYQLIT